MDPRLVDKIQELTRETFKVVRRWNPENNCALASIFQVRLSNIQIIKHASAIFLNAILLLLCVIIVKSMFEGSRTVQLVATVSKVQHLYIRKSACA